MNQVHPYIGVHVAIAPVAVHGTATSGSVRANMVTGMQGRVVYVHDKGIVLLTPEGRHETVPYDQLAFDAATVSRLEAQWTCAPAAPIPTSALPIPVDPSGIAWPPRPVGHRNTWTRAQWVAMVAVAPTLSALVAFIDLDTKTIGKEMRRHGISAPWARPRSATRGSEGATP